VSYRREDSGYIADRICERLVRDLGRENVFKDVDSIPLGVDFATQINQELKRCTALFAIIGPRWLAAAKNGFRRLDDPNDFVRIEVASALRREVRVVPVLVEGAVIPSVEDLPMDLRPLSRRNGITVRPDPDFHSDVGRLLSGLS
jgi:hypothetical protein